MTEKSLTHEIDRSGWKPGPWDDEPDRKEWRFMGLPCLALRNPQGAWCGYVGVPSGHSAFEKGYEDVDVRVHGGLTYAGHCQAPICHVPQEGETDNVWWLGFDCCHGFDKAPAWSRHPFTGILFFGMDDLGSPNNAEYRDLEYVTNEVNSLAEQLCRGFQPALRQEGGTR